MSPSVQASQSAGRPWRRLRLPPKCLTLAARLHAATATALGPARSLHPAWTLLRGRAVPTTGARSGGLAAGLAARATGRAGTLPPCAAGGRMCMHMRSCKAHALGPHSVLNAAKYTLPCCRNADGTVRGWQSLAVASSISPEAGFTYHRTITHTIYNWINANWM